MSRPAKTVSLLLASLLFALSVSARGAAPDPEVLLAAEPGSEPPAFADAGRHDERSVMVEHQVLGRGVTAAAVLDAMRTVPRHRFVPERRRGRAYDDTPLPIGHGQTISQPFIVAYMTERLALEPGDRVLEIGTGSGYQAAVLAQVADHVVSMEIVRPLAESAAARLARLGYRNVTVVHGDGYYGYPGRGPYDAIVVTAAAAHVPPPLVDQLARDGHMAIPVGEAAWTQNLLLVEKAADGGISTRNLMPVRFVPLTGEH